MLAAYCFDNRYVFVLSTIHGTGNFEVRGRESDNHLLKPIATNEYNKFMGWVDHFDQLLSSYFIKRKSKKWWKKVFYHLTKVSFINAYLIFSSLNPQHKSNRRHRYIRKMLIPDMFQALLDARNDPENPEEQTVERHPNINAARLRGKLFPFSRYPTKKRCTVCGYKKNAKGNQAKKKTVKMWRAHL